MNRLAQKMHFSTHERRSNMTSSLLGEHWVQVPHKSKKEQIVNGAKWGLLIGCFGSAVIALVFAVKTAVMLQSLGTL
jgi:hypothetical protein